MVVLDTHVLIWYATGSAKLDERFANYLEKNRWDVFISAITFWEIALLINRGAISFEPEEPGDWATRLLIESGFQELPVTREIAILSHSLEFTHRDPADQLIAASAFHLGAQLATSDRRLRELDWVNLAY